MSEQEPEAEHWLSKYVEDSIGDNLGVEPNETSTVSDTPDAAQD